MLKIQAELKHLRLQIFFSSDFPTFALVDEFRISQILVNLLSNAVKFTDQGSVKLFCEKASNGNLIFMVEDTGIGIDPQNIKKLFSNYVQLDSNSRSNGTGLGLSLSYKLAKLMNGDIQCQSQKNIGSKFIFSMPFIE